MTSSDNSQNRPLFTLGSWEITPGTLALLLLAGLFIAFGWQTFHILAAVYQTVEDYSHGFVIPAVSLYAAWEIRKQHPHASYSPSWWGVPTVIIGALLVILGIWYRSAFLLNSLGEATPIGLGLFMVLAGLVLACGGRRLAGHYLFPLGFLAFCIPWPERLTIMVTGPLRIFVTDMSALAIKSQGIWVTQNGNILHLATCTLGVADACSGIRSLWVMLATAVALGYFLRCSTLQTIILMVISIPLAVFFNVVRVVATALQVVWLGPGYAEGTPHEVTGSIVFFCGVVTLVAIGCVFAWQRQKRAAAGASTAPGSTTVAEPSGRWTCPPLLAGTLVLLLALGAVAQIVVEQHYRVKPMPVATRRSFAAFPAKIGAFTESGPGTFVKQQLDLLKPSDTLSRIYRSPKGAEINLWSLYWEPYRGSKAVDLGPHSPDGCYPMTGWRKSGSSTVTDLVPGHTVNLRLFTRGKERMVLAYYTTSSSGYDHSIPVQLGKRFRKMIATWKAPEIAQEAQYVVVVQAPVTTTDEQAQKDVVDFLRDLAPVLPAFGV